MTKEASIGTYTAKGRQKERLYMFLLFCQETIRVQGMGLPKAHNDNIILLICHSIVGTNMKTHSRTRTFYHHAETHILATHWLDAQSRSEYQLVHEVVVTSLNQGNDREQKGSRSQ